MIPMVPVFNGLGFCYATRMRVHVASWCFTGTPRHQTGPWESWADPSPLVLGTGPEREGEGRGPVSGESVPLKSNTAPGC